MSAGMNSLEQIRAERKAARQSQAEAERKALAYRDAHPVSPEEQAHLSRILEGLVSPLSR